MIYLISKTIVFNEENYKNISCVSLNNILGKLNMVSEIYFIYVKKLKTPLKTNGAAASNY